MELFSTLFTELSGVNFDDITEETLKKGKLWQKFLQKQTKRNSDLDKKFAKVFTSAICKCNTIMTEWLFKKINAPSI